MTTFALIDKYAIVRTGIGLYLQTQLDEITLLESESINGFSQLYPDQNPDLMILGISQSTEMQNISLIKSTKKYYPESKIVLYDEASASFYGSAAGSQATATGTGSTVRGQSRIYPASSSTVLNYLREGVNGYITKLNNLTELITCIRDVLMGKRYICSDVYDTLIYQDLSKNEMQSRINNLSSREYEIASYLLEGLSTNSIALKVGRKATTISTIKSNIFKKLNVDNVLKLQQVFHPKAVQVTG